MDKVIHQLNLQESLGGGEVYTRSLCRALAGMGWRTRLYVNERATFWPSLQMPETQIVTLESMEHRESALGRDGRFSVVQNPRSKGRVAGVFHRRPQHSQRHFVLPGIEITANKDARVRIGIE